MTDRIIAIGDVHGCGETLATDQVNRHYGEAVVGQKNAPLTFRRAGSVDVTMSSWRCTLNAP